MSILWAGIGEDIDFAMGSVLPQSQNITTSTSRFRSAYCRAAIGHDGTSASGVFISQPFQSGTPITAGWLHFMTVNDASPYSSNNSQILGGLTQSGNPAGQGIYVCLSAASATRLAIGLWNGTTITQLAAEVGNSVASSAMVQVDMQIISYGATGTINLYANGVLICTYSGNISVSGITGFNQAACRGPASAVGGGMWHSEFIVADEDTRSFALKILPPASVGDTDAWSGAVADINEIVLNDATLNTTNTVALDQEYLLGALPAGLFQVRAIQLVARSSNGAGLASKIALGVRTAGTTFPGTPTSLSATWVTQQSLLTQNPNTSAPWVNTDVNALQLNLRSS